MAAQHHLARHHGVLRGGRHRRGVGRAVDSSLRRSIRHRRRGCGRRPRTGRSRSGRAPVAAVRRLRNLCCGMGGSGLGAGHHGGDPVVPCQTVRGVVGRFDRLVDRRHRDHPVRQATARQPGPGSGHAVAGCSLRDRHRARRLVRRAARSGIGGVGTRRDPSRCRRGGAAIDRRGVRGRRSNSLLPRGDHRIPARARSAGGRYPTAGQARGGSHRRTHRTVRAHGDRRHIGGGPPDRWATSCSVCR